MKQKFKIKDDTYYKLYWHTKDNCLYKEYFDFLNNRVHFSRDETGGAIIKNQLESPCIYRLNIMPAYQIEAFEAFLTHNPKAKNLTLESAKELLKTFLDNHK